MGTLIVIEGTDCSGKETQSNLLYERLEDPKFKTSFPMYDTPTGKIIAGPYLGKEGYEESYFEEGAANVDPEVAMLYYAADRAYNIDKVEERLKNNETVILDRYVESNMAHQGGKITDPEKRKKVYDQIEKLEYHALCMPRPDLTIFLYMPYEYACILKQHRNERPDGHESSKEHLMNAEKAYLELAERYDYKIVNCVKDGLIRSKEEIADEVYEIVNEFVKKKAK